MNIKNITLHNFKTIKDFSSEFNGGVYLIAGENEIGKSTLLGSISTLLTGDRSSNLLKQGEEKGFAKMTVGEGDKSFEVELKFTDKNPRGTLSITADNGMKSDKKSMLQELFKYNDFDAHEFISWSNTAEGKRKQVELVKSLLPAETQDEISSIESNISKIKESRTGVNVEVRHLEGVVSKKRKSESDCKEYGEPVDPIELMNQKMKASDHNRQIDEVKTRRDERESILATYNEETAKETASLDGKVERLTKELKEAENAREVYSRTREQRRLELLDKNKGADKWLSENQAISTADIDQKIHEAESHNEIHKEVKDFLGAKQDLETYSQKAKDLTLEINDLEDDKSRLIREAKMPIDGLTFNEEGLFLNRVPFAPGEVSTSQEMEVAAKLIMAKNPTVKVFRIAQGESLGADKLKAIVDFANENGYQGFIEEVRRGQNELVVENYQEN